jgi:hypothetical protein
VHSVSKDSYGTTERLTVWQRSIVVVDELLAVEGNQTLQNTETDATSADGAHNLAFEIESVASDVGDLPITDIYN